MSYKANIMYGSLQDLTFSMGSIKKRLVNKYNGRSPFIRIDSCPFHRISMKFQQFPLNEAQFYGIIFSRASELESAILLTSLIAAAFGLVGSSLDMPTARIKKSANWRAPILISLSTSYRNANKQYCLFNDQYFASSLVIHSFILH